MDIKKIIETENGLNFAKRLIDAFEKDKKPLEKARCCITNLLSPTADELEALKKAVESAESTEEIQMAMELFMSSHDIPKNIPIPSSVVYGSSKSGKLISKYALDELKKIVTTERKVYSSEWKPMENDPGLLKLLKEWK